GDRGDQPEVVQRRWTYGAEDLARLADRATQERRRFVDLLVLDPGALELGVSRDEDGREAIVKIACQTAAVLFVLREELPGEVLEIPIELHPLDRERGLVGEDSQEEGSVVPGMG